MKKKGFTLIELMMVILILGILAAVMIPLVKSRINTVKWSEGTVMMNSIATAICDYHDEAGPAGDPPTSLHDLGFEPGDLDGNYFVGDDFKFNVSSMDPLKYIITAIDTDLSPQGYTLNEKGVYTRIGRVVINDMYMEQ